MLKIAKNGLILHKVGSFGFSQIFFASPSPIQPRPRRKLTWQEPKILSPPIKNLEKKTLEVATTLPLGKICYKKQPH